MAKQKLNIKVYKITSEINYNIPMI